MVFFFGGSSVLWFFGHLIDWVLAIFNSARISVLLDGVPHGYFPCSRGVRQGDPLSPLSFCLAEDFLSRYLTHLSCSRAMDSISPPRGTHDVMHFFYADDVLIFCRASLKNLRAILSAFELYASLSGQIVNWEKSNVYFGKGVSHTRIRDLLSICGMKRSGESLHYLGVSLFVGAP